MDDPSKRLNIAIKSLHLTQKQLAEELGTSKSAISAIACGSRPMTERFAFRLERAFGVNASWILTGEGEMSISKNSGTEITGGESKEKAIPFYDAETTGGYEGQVSDSNIVTQLVGYIQPGGWFDGRETAAIRHVGDSMIEYPNGCILAVREVTERHLLVPGKNYVVETSEYRVTKRVQRGSSPKSIALYSTNKEKYDDGRLVYEPFEVEFADIRRIFSVLGYIVNQSGEFRLIKKQ